MGVVNSLAFVREEIGTLPGVRRKPSGGIAAFAATVGRAVRLALTEKEIVVFALGQWAAIGLAYLLWTQMLDWIPEEVWRSAANSDGASPVDWLLLAWSFVCVGLAAYPVGILTGCMGAAHLLHRTGERSTIARCLLMVVPHSWPLWSFHWIDGWITVNRILDRLPRKGDRRTRAQRAAAEAVYYAWKLGVAGVLPGIVTGRGLVESGRRSIAFVRDNLLAVARLRAGYSAVCWVVGIAAYLGAIVLAGSVEIVPPGKELYGHMYSFYLWMGFPILAAAGVVILILRPIYVLALCEMYAAYLEREGEPLEVPYEPSRALSALVAFVVLGIGLAIAWAWRDELGLTAALSVPFGR